MGLETSGGCAAADVKGGEGGPILLTRGFSAEFLGTGLLSHKRNRKGEHPP